jgi:phage shock protein A
MGIFSRMGDIVAANVNDMLEKAEDPAKMIRLIIMEMEETLVDVRTSAARTIANQKEARRTLTRLADAQSGWAEKAELAMSKGREDLAKAALLEKQKMADMSVQITNDVLSLDEVLGKHEQDIQKLEAKLREARSRQQTIVARLETLENRARMRGMMASPKIDEAFARFAQLERRVDLAEGRVESFDLGQKKSLAEEIASLQTDDAVEAELTALREKMAKQ